MQPTTTGMAAILAQVRMLGRDSEVFAHPLVVAMFIRPTNTAEASSIPVLTFAIRTSGYGSANVKSAPLGQPCDRYDLLVTSLARLGVEKLGNPARALGADARDLAEIGDRGPLDFLQGSEMVQQGAFARGADAGDLLQAGFANVL